MGYIFDALNRAEGGKGPARKPVVPGPDPAAPLPAWPGDAAGAPAAPPPVPAPSAELLADLDQADGLAPEPLKLDLAAVAAAAAGPAVPTTPNPPQYEGVDDRIVALLRPASVMAEEYRSIRTGLLARWQNKRHLIHTITSATPQEGKTITSLNLGFSFAELRNRKAVVLEADLRLPQFGKMLGLPDSPGLLGLLDGQAQCAEVIRTLPGSSLAIIPAGGRANDQSVQLLSSPAMGALLKMLRQRYDHVIIDTPPVVQLADAGILGAQSDDVLLIVRMGHTPRTLVEQAMHTLSSYNAPVAGMIATDQPHHRRRYDYYKYGYHYHYYHSYHSEAA